MHGLVRLGWVGVQMGGTIPKTLSRVEANMWPGMMH